MFTGSLPGTIGNATFAMAYLSDYASSSGPRDVNGFPRNGSFYDFHPNLTGIECNFYFARWQLNYSYAENVQSVSQIAQKMAGLGPNQWYKNNGGQTALQEGDYPPHRARCQK